MPMKTLKASVRQQPGISVIDLRGEIDVNAEDILITAYTEAEQSRVDVILLNFRDVRYINSTGIALIVGLLARARKQGRRLLACGLSDHYVEIFQVTRLSDFLHIFPDEASALTMGVADSRKAE